MVAGARRADSSAAAATVIELPEMAIVGRLDAPPARTAEQITTIPAGFAGVGRGAANRPQDVLFIREMLSKIVDDSTPEGLILLSQSTNNRMTPELQAAITQFQNDNHLVNRSGRADGVISAGGNGGRTPTLTAMRTQTTARMATVPAAVIPPASQPVVDAARGGGVPPSVATSAGAAPTRTTAQKILIDFPAAQRAGNVITEEIFGGGRDIAQGWERNNFGQILQGFGAGAGGVVRMVGSIASYPIGLVGNLATRASDAMWDETRALWNRGGFGNGLLAVLLAIPTVLLKIAAMALNAASAIIDGIFKFLGETIIEGLFSWVGEAIGGRRKNESDIRAGVREAEEDARETAAEQERIRKNELEQVRGSAQAARNLEIRNAESELSTLRGTLTNNQRMIATINAIPQAQRTAFQASQLATLPVQNAALTSTIAAKEQDLANLRSAPLPTPIAVPAATVAPTVVPNPA